MKPETNLLDFALPYQEKFITSSKKRRIWLSSRQIGKSWTAAFIAVQQALSKQNGLALCISTGSRAASELLKKCAQMAEACHIIDPSISYSASANTIKFTNGARVLSLPSGNPAGLRGWSASCVVIDEGAFIENPEQVYASISPTLARDKDAVLVVTSTPAGMHGWFYDLYQKALYDEDWYVQTTTVEDAVKDGLDVDIAELKKTINDPQVWDQEFMCKFASEYGAMIDTSVLQFQTLETAQYKGRFVGIDIGASNDRTAIVDILQLNDGTYYVNDIVMLRKADYQHQLQVIKELNAKNNWSGGYVDAVGIGNPIAEFANKQVSVKIKGFNWTVASKTPAYENMRALIFDRKLVFSAHLRELIIADFNNVHRIVSEVGKVSYQAGRYENGHSDATSALVLALQAAKDMPINAVVPTAAPFSSAFGKWNRRF